MNELINFFNSILGILKYLVPLFLIFISLFFTVGLFRTYAKATMAIKELLVRPSSFIVWILIGVGTLIIWFLFIDPLLPF